MKDALTWFRHDTDFHESTGFYALHYLQGFEGIGRFWTLYEAIASSPSAQIDLSKQWPRIRLGELLKLDPRKLDDFLKIVTDPGLGLLKLEEGILSADELQEGYSRVSHWRARDRERKRSPGGKSRIPDGNGEIPGGESTVSSVTAQTAQTVQTDSTAQRARAELSPGEEEALRAFALGWAKKQRGIGNPEGFARKRWQDPDVVAAWRKSLEPPPPPVEPLPPATPDEIAEANAEADRIMREARARPGLGQALSGAAGAV